MNTISKKSAEIIFNCLPEPTRLHLELLEKIVFPLHDKCSFTDQLKEMKDQTDTPLKHLVSQMDNRFSARYFPILTLENAVEKYWELFRPSPFPRPIPRPEFDFDFTLPEDIRERPSVCSTYRDTFDDAAAAACACRRYSEAIRQGLTEYQAVIIGIQAGNRFRDTGRCS